MRINLVGFGTALPEPEDSLEPISSDLLKVRRIAGKPMMNRGTLLTMHSLMDLLERQDFDDQDYLKNIDAFHFGTGPIFLDPRVWEALSPITQDGDTSSCYNWEKLPPLIPKLPPLAGIKSLATASCHFAACGYQSHGSGNPWDTADQCGLQALVASYLNLRMGIEKRSLVGASFSPKSETGPRFLPGNGNSEGAICCLLDTQQDTESGIQVSHAWTSQLSETENEQVQDYSAHIEILRDLSPLDAHSMLAVGHTLPDKYRRWITEKFPKMVIEERYPLTRFGPLAGLLGVRLATTMSSGSIWIHSYLPGHGIHSVVVQH